MLRIYETHLCKQKDTLSVYVSEAEDVKWMLCLHSQVLTQLGTSFLFC
jgi:hypothetical protein